MDGARCTVAEASEKGQIVDETFKRGQFVDERFGKGHIVDESFGRGQTRFIKCIFINSMIYEVVMLFNSF